MTGRTVRAVIVHTTGDTTIGVIPVELADLQRIVAGHIECVTLNTDGTHMYCNEDAAFDGLAVNTVATATVHMMRPALSGQQVHGDVVFLGTTKGNEGHIAQWAVDQIMAVAFKHRAGVTL